MPRRREIPLSPIGTVSAHGGGYMQHDDSDLERAGTHPQAPLTELAALMEALPNCTPLTSREEMLPLRDVLADAIETVLTERERWIFEACVIERKSIRAVGADLQLAKSHVDRIKHAACKKLACALAGEPIIESYLSRGQHELSDRVDVRTPRHGGRVCDAARAA